MPKKGKNKKFPKDFTINDSANAEKPLSRGKKSSATEKSLEQQATVDEDTELPWDHIPLDEEYDIVKQTNADGTTNLVSLKRPKNLILETSSEYKEYPEIFWYHISRYIGAEDIGRFAQINRSTYAITQQKSFWYGIYRRFSHGNTNLPKKLKIEDDCQSFGLKTRVIKGLYYTHKYFTQNVIRLGTQDSKPLDVIRYKCLNIWFHKGRGHWAIFFKFKKPQLERPPDKMDVEDLEKIDANPETECKVLQVHCQFFYEIPPLMGMTLTSVKVGLSRGLRSHKILMGFNSSPHVSNKVLPECTVVLDTVTSIMLIDWWHPNYPHFEIKFDWHDEDERSIGAQEIDIFAPYRANS